jgi:hypothetical protein
VDRQHVTGPNILCLPRDWSEYEIRDGNGDPIPDLEGGLEIFLAAKAKTSPVVVSIVVTWGGFDTKGLSLKLSIAPRVHFMETRNQLLSCWIEHYRTRPEHREIASHLVTDEAEYVWKDQGKVDACPPWEPDQQVESRMIPWMKENTAKRQRKRPQPPPDGRQDPLGPFSH